MEPSKEFLKPLFDKSMLLMTQSQRIDSMINQVTDLLYADASCPLCGGQPAVLSATIDIHQGHYAVSLGCDHCKIKTYDSHWFISEPESLLKAFQAVINIWNNNEHRKNPD
ncbi:hypothetical protein [Methylophaga lonarensis]|uniref:hypothetical protein n=1 Tax=Methylophaga lonarensis TaxID=999151 RepID=UPI003D2DD3C6